MRRSADIGTGAYVSGRPWLSVWTIVEGYPDCVVPPLSLTDADPVFLAQTVAVNRAVASICGRAEALEMAIVLAARDAPPATMTGLDADGDIIEVPSPAFQIWAAAAALVAAEADNTDLHHLLRTRADALIEDLEGTEPGWVMTLPNVPVVDPFTETADWNASSWEVRALTEDEAAGWPLREPPVPEAVTRTQLRLVLAEMPAPAGEAEPNACDYVDRVVATSNDRELKERWAAERMERHNPYLVGMAGGLLGLTPAEVDAAFHRAAAK